MEHYLHEWDDWQKKEWGVSPPRSLDMPVAADFDRTNALKRFLDQTGISESKDDPKLELVFAELLKIAKSLVKSITSEKGLQFVEESNAVFFSFGSYRLGVYIPGDDLDILCVGPSYVNRKHFFTVLDVTLRKMEEVTELQCFPDAHIPAIKFKFHGISIDFIYVSVPLQIVPNEFDISNDVLISDEVLSDKDDTALRCLNMCRVATDILELVPEREVFQTTLRFLKHWAKTRGIYCNDTGFLGGTTWALLVARICQAHPYALSSTLISRFFDIYDGWVWPTPVMLCHIMGDEKIGLVWNPKSPTDKNDIMPIITPSYPCRNLSANVSKVTLRVLMEQFKICNKICKKMKMDHDWHELCQPFLEAYELYLCIKISANDAQDLEAWKGWIKPFWRQLPTKIEVSFGVLHCHLNPHEYVDPSGGAAVYLFIGLSSIQQFQCAALQPQITQVSRSVIQEFERDIQEYKLVKTGMKFRVFHCKKNNIVRLGLGIRGK